MIRKTIASFASLSALGLLTLGESVQAQNRLLNPSFEVGAFTSWIGGTSMGLNYWYSPSMMNGKNAALLQGVGIRQSGYLSSWSAGTDLLVVDCAGYRGRTGAANVPVDVAMWGLNSGTSGTFSVYTTPNATSSSSLNRLAGLKTFALPFTFWNTGNGSSTLQISTNDPDGVVVDNAYLLNLNPTVSPKTPAAFSAVNGCAYSGTLANLWNSDASPVTIFSDPTTDTAGMLAAAISPTATPTQLSVGFRMARTTTSPNVEYRISLYDFVNKAWTDCSSIYPQQGPFVGTVQQTSTLNGNGLLSRFVGQNNVVLARVWWNSNSHLIFGSSGGPFTALVDQVIFTIQ